MSTTKAKRSLRDTLIAAEEASRDQQFNIGHAAALLTTLAREAGEACVGRKDDGGMHAQWLRVEYLARQLKAHVSDLDRSLAAVEGVHMQMGRDAA
ncbi:hypothetical protein [uncultured Reyranella sp.]|uniref:hypothetical protein n=1 Tax=uncultured Reyranella sp. TaxID=735512 RepID=UPI0025F7B1EF|nr:hypothetical protein [uncultured Reyranella sp.]